MKQTQRKPNPNASHSRIAHAGRATANAAHSTTNKEKPLDFNLTVFLVIAVVAGAAWLVWSNAKPGSEGTVIAAQRNAVYQTISPQQYKADFAGTPHLLLDVRTPEEFAGGHIAGAVNISLQTLPQRLETLPKDQPIVLYCRSGNRSNQAAQIMARAGFTQLYDLGGIIDWRAQGYPVQ